MTIGMSDLMHYQTKSGAAITESRDKNGNLLFVSSQYNRFFIFSVFVKITAHLMDKFTGRIRFGRQGIGNLTNGIITDTQLIFIDQCVIDTIDGHFLQSDIVQKRGSLIMFKTQSFKKILVYNVCAA